MRRPSESRLICTASMSTCNTMTPVSRTSDLWREGMATIGRYSLSPQITGPAHRSHCVAGAHAGRADQARLGGAPHSRLDCRRSFTLRTGWLFGLRLVSQGVAPLLRTAKHYQGERGDSP